MSCWNHQKIQQVDFHILMLGLDRWRFAVFACQTYKMELHIHPWFLGKLFITYFKARVSRLPTGRFCEHPSYLPDGRFSVRLKLDPICVGSLFLPVVDLKSTKTSFILDDSKCYVIQIASEIEMGHVFYIFLIFSGL